MFKKVLLFVIALVLVSTSCFAEWVNGYSRSNGTYVNGYNRSDRNDTVQDNYSYKGNQNPYTGSTGSNYERNNQTSAYYGTRPNSTASNNPFGRNND